MRNAENKKDYRNKNKTKQKEIIFFNYTTSFIVGWLNMFLIYFKKMFLGLCCIQKPRSTFSWCILKKKLIFENKKFTLWWWFSFFFLYCLQASNIIWRLLCVTLAGFSVGSYQFACSYLNFKATVGDMHVTQAVIFLFPLDFFPQNDISRWEICFSNNQNNKILIST